MLNPRRPRGVERHAPTLFRQGLEHGFFFVGLGFHLMRRGVFQWNATADPEPAIVRDLEPRLNGRIEMVDLGRGRSVSSTKCRKHTRRREPDTDRYESPDRSPLHMCPQ